MSTEIKNQFQTPEYVAEYMVDLIHRSARTALEPTPGHGAIVEAIGRLKPNIQVTAPEDYFKQPKAQYDVVIMNPPFSDKFGFGIPDEIKNKVTGMKLGYHILNECMEQTDHVIALMPWFCILDSSPRLRHYQEYGLRSITALPRSVFNYARIQCMIMDLVRGWHRGTEFYSIHTPQKTIFS